ncbi:LysR family transcriptional regulator [Paracoccus aurantiacus]|uniref:LysR family transcriptional regulator n=1 Tax=Paracoccus aurantiacus TaxID=2599412 RepID=A0A5C6RQ31_9RHOB|nr:LysR family transcriptional regulator [Paracoccus aurantiacus]TXB64074.1 LysR family transcriptional regulator [Paracoccus aurantiacus]
MSNLPPRMMLKPNQLRLLRAIEDHGKLQLAAETCAVSQPAASRMLAETERQFGAPLFVRHPTGMEPTEIGRQTLRHARTILRELDHMGRDALALREGRAGTLHIGAVTGPAVRFLVSAIREIKRTAPGADISVDVMPSRDLLEHLVAGDMDFVVGRILPEFDSRDFDIVPLDEERVRFLVRADHPLARAPSVTLTEIADAEWIMQQRGAPIREAALAAFADVGLSEPANIVSSPSLLFTIAYLAQSDAISPISEEVAELLIAHPIRAQLARLKVGRVVRVSPYYLLNLRRRPLTPLMLSFRRALLNHANANGGYEQPHPVGPA